MRYLLFLLIPFFSASAVAQGLSPSTSTVNFGNVFENAPDSQLIYISNTSANTIEVKAIRFYRTYANFPFSTSKTSMTIEAGNTDSVWIRFSPVHNILHNSELFIVTEPSAYSFTIDLKGQGKYSNTYYSTTENKSEEDLKAALKARLALGYVQLGYSNLARDKMFMEIDNQKVNGRGATVNTLECIYTGKKSIGYSSRTQSQTDDNFNTEHTFPQGFFSQNEPMRSDIHHLFPTNDAANNSRNNFAFGVATTPYKNDAINTPSHLGANNLYEPRDEQKGRTARAMMYFVIRYQDYTNFFAPQEAILRQWHQTFPPDSIDRKRNSDIEVYQKNRNPFVDYPQFAERIQSIVGNTSAAPVVNGIDQVDTLDVGTITDSVQELLFNASFINTGNRKVSLRSVSLTGHYSSMQTAVDSLEIETGDAASLPLFIQLQDTTLDFTDTLSYTTSFAPAVTKHIIIKGRFERNGGPATGVADQRNTALKIYPNPAKDEVSIVVAGEELRSAILINTIGVKKVVAVNDHKISLSDMAPGMYILYLQTSKNNYFERLLIQR